MVRVLQSQDDLVVLESTLDWVMLGQIELIVLLFVPSVEQLFLLQESHVRHQVEVAAIL